MSMIEQRIPQELQHMLSLKPVENDPYAEISLTEAFDDAFLGLHNVSKMSPEQYAEARSFHSIRVLAVLDSFTRGVILEGYRTNQVFSDNLGYDNAHFRTKDISSHMSLKRDGDEVRLVIDHAKETDTPQWSWDYRINIHYDSEYTYSVIPKPGEIFKRLKIDYMQPSQNHPNTVPISQNWSIVFHEGSITSIEKRFNVPIDIGTAQEQDSNNDNSIEVTPQLNPEPFDDLWPSR